MTQSRRDEYHRYLQSPEWRDIRLAVLSRTSSACQLCGDFAAQVHHVRYPKKFGDEHPHSLVPLCGRCHRISHGIQPMKTLTNVSPMRELAPTGIEFRYLLTERARVYASAQSWAKALKLPHQMMGWFESCLAMKAMVSSADVGEDLEMSYLGRTVYRWHAIAEALREFDRSFHSHGYKMRSEHDREAIAEFHSRYSKLVRWGYDLQEKALASLIESGSDGRVSQAQLVEAIKKAVAPRLQGHDEQLVEHRIIIDEIRDAVPALRDEDDFITVKQAVSEKGFDGNMMPLYPKRETLTGVAGQMLKSKGVAQGPTVISRLDGQSMATTMNTYRRADIYAVLEEIMQKKPTGLL